MKLFAHWVLSAIAIAVAAYIVPSVSVTFQAAVVGAIVIGALNMFVRPILVVLTLPITVLTLGFFSLVLNALLVLLAASFVPGFVVPTFWAAFFFAIVLSVVNWVFALWGND